MSRISLRPGTLHPPRAKCTLPPTWDSSRKTCISTAPPRDLRRWYGQALISPRSPRPLSCSRTRKSSWRNRSGIRRSRAAFARSQYQSKRSYRASQQISTTAQIERRADDNRRAEWNGIQACRLPYQVSMKEARNAPPSVQRCRLVVGDAPEAQQLEPELLLVVHERVPGVGIFLHIVSNQGALKRLFKLFSDALLPMTLSSIATDDRAGGLKELVNIGRKFPSVVDARCRESVTRNE